MKIAITGATGFLGKNAANYFTELGHNVTGFGRNKSKSVDLKCEFVQADINNYELMKKHITGCDIVIHSAALSSPWGPWEDFRLANIEGTKTLMKISEEVGIKKFIHISTPSIYFKFNDEFDILENKPLSEPFASLYTKSKYEAEKLFKDWKVPHVILRPRGIFGPGDEALLPRLLKVAGTKGLPTFGTGDNLIDVTYVDNVTQAIEAAINADPKYNGEIYNITNGEPVKIWELLRILLNELKIPHSSKRISLKKGMFLAKLMERIFKVLPFLGEPPLTKYTVGLLCYSQTLNIDKARKELNYQPKIDMNQALKNVIQWWKNEHA